MRQTAEITFRLAQLDDRPAVLALLRGVGLTDEGLSGHWDGALVASEGDRVVGSALLEFYDDGTLLRSVAVDPVVQGKGVGSMLTEHALAMAVERGVRSVFLLTETAGSFFPRFGFRQILRDQVPAGVATSVEFTSVCPSTALVMVTEVGD